MVANHVSFVDPFYLFIAYLPAFVAKKDVEVRSSSFFRSSLFVL